MTWAAREPLLDGYDVVCIGGAMTGSSTAYFLAENPDFSGTVLVVEPDWTYDRAATTRAHNSIREQFTNPLNIALSQFGIEFISRFHDNVQVDGSSPNLDFRGTGYLFVASDEEHFDRLERESSIQLEHGAQVEMLRAAQVAERCPYMDTAHLVGARIGSVREGSFDGWALFQGIRQRAIHRGVTFVHDEVVGLDVRAGRVDAVELASGRSVACGAVVNAAGVRARRIASMVGLDLPVEPRARTTFVFGCRTPIEEIVPLTILPEGVHFRRDQHHFLCGTVPIDDHAVDDDDLEIRHDEFEDRIWPAIARYVPVFDEVGIVTSWGGQYDYNTLDHNLVIGPSSQVVNFHFANGFSGHGLQQGPAVGRGLSELLTYGEFRTIDLRPLGYDRITRNEPILEGAVI